MKRIIYTQANGVLAIIIPSPRWEGTIEELAAKDVPEGLEYKIVTTEEIPSDRYFRSAWKDSAGAVDVDMPKAQDIHMGNIRRSRDKELKRLDIEQMRGNDVALEKQALRDLPTSFDLSGAATPEALKVLWPTELPSS